MNNDSTLSLNHPSQLCLFELPPARSWRIPEARCDRDYRIAVVLRNIHWLHDNGGCRKDNEFFAHHDTMGIGKDVATVRRALSDLEGWGLIRREFDRFGKRSIIPLVSVEELIEAGWEALARAIVGMKEWKVEIRSLCRQLLQRLGKWQAPRMYQLSPRAFRGEGTNLHSEKDTSQNNNCAGTARTIARPLPIKELKAQKTITEPSTDADAPLSYQAQPTSVVVVSRPSKPEPDPEAVTIATEAGLSLQAARRVTSEKPVAAVKSTIRAAKAYAARSGAQNLPGLLYTAIRDSWQPAAAPPTHPSECRAPQCRPVLVERPPVDRNAAAQGAMKVPALAQILAQNAAKREAQNPMSLSQNTTTQEVAL